MRQYMEGCFRNLQDRMYVFGFEGWDIFIVLGTALILQTLNVNNLIVWLSVGGMAGFLLIIKRGRPPEATEHFIDWFLKDKKFTAFPQIIFDSIKGRGIDVKLNSLQELLPYSHLEDEFLVFQDDSLSIGFEITCPDIESYSNEELIFYSQKIETFLSTLSERASYQIFFTIDSNYQKEIDEHKSIKSLHPLVKAMHQERIGRFTRMLNSQLFRRRRLYLFINFSPTNLQEKKYPFLSGLRKFYEQDIESSKNEFRLILNNLEESLSGCGFLIHRLSVQSLMKLIYKYLNPDREKQNVACPIYREEINFTKQVSCSDVYLDEKKGEFVHYGGFFHKYISLKILPQATSPALLLSMNTFSFSDFDVIVNFQAPSKEWGRRKIESMRKREYGNVQGMFGIANKDAQTKIAQYESLLEEIQQSNQKLFLMQLTIHIYAQEYDEVKRRASEVIRVFSSLNGAEMHDERWGSVKPIFLSTLPGWTKESSRWLLLKSLHLADFLPLFSQFDGSGQAECLFFNTSHGLAGYNPFYEELSAFNMVVIGASGSGKSFTINQIINQYSKNDPVEIFIDIGGSYKRQVLLKNGEFINLGLKEKFTINLFDLSSGRSFKDFSEEEQNEIVIIKTKTIEQMMGGVSRFRESDQIVEDFVFRSVQWLYENIEHPVLSDLKTALQKISEEFKQYQPFYSPVIGLLGNWFKGGQYGMYTDGKSTISLNNSVVCFDLKGLEQFERLQATMLTIVTNFVWGKIMSEPGRRKFVIFDECWKLLSTPESAKFIAECYRTFRKYGAAAISITQSLEDFLGSGLENAILGNSNTRFILKQNSAPAVKAITDYFNFNEQEKKLIESLQIKKGEYSEVFFSQVKQLKHISGKMIVCPTPMEYWVATTDAMDLNYFESVKRETPNLNLYEVLTKCAHDFPQGVSFKKESEVKCV